MPENEVHLLMKNKKNMLSDEVWGFHISASVNAQFFISYLCCFEKLQMFQFAFIPSFGTKWPQHTY